MILIGCPVYQREWILPDWFAAIEGQTIPLDQLGFIFEVDPQDLTTIEALMDFSEVHPELRCFDIIVNDREEHAHHPEGHRSWNVMRYQAMANMRNDLLNRVTCKDPDRYFSLDSDILLENPTTIEKLVELTETLDAVSPLTFMTPDGTDFPNVMTWASEPGGYAMRKTHTYPIGSVFQSDIIMAAVMMSKQVYQNSRYGVHRQGEDLGWSADCAMKGLKLYNASHIFTPHIMSRGMLEKYKKYGDPRGVKNGKVQGVDRPGLMHG